MRDKGLEFKYQEELEKRMRESDRKDRRVLEMMQGDCMSAF